MGKKPKIGCIVSTLCFVAFTATIYYEFLSHHSIEGKLGLFKGGCLSLVFFLVGLLASDFTWRITSDYYSFKNLWIHYTSLLFLRLASFIFHRLVVKDTRNVRGVQEKFILDLIKSNALTDYGKAHDFSSIKSVEDFKSCHPLTRYSYYENYIDRVYNGETNVMTSLQPYILAMTSGTSGQPKMLPTVKKGRSLFFTYGLLPLFHILFTNMDGINNLQKKLKFFYTPRWRQTPSGISIGPNSSSPTNSQAELSFHSTPAAAFDILSEPEALYVYLLFGLRDKKLGYLEANFASLIYTAFVSLESNWKDLLTDLRNGYIKPDLNIDSSVRKRLNSELSPFPDRANELQTEFERGFLGIAKKIWPYMNFILCVDSGSFQVYGDLLRKTYCKGLHIYSPIYAATEGFIGINLWPFSPDSQYLMIPKVLFYEFIPIEKSLSCEQPETLLLHEVTEGEVYEMVISNCSGLYRYRFGDVVKVVGFHNQSPIVEFMYRQGQFLNVRGEKTSEKLFYEAFHDSFNMVMVGYSLLDYCCVEQLPQSGEETPKYIVFMEVGGKEVTPSVSLVNQLAEELDKQLQSSYIYKSFRDKGSIAQVKVHLVKPMTFSKFRRTLILSEKATPNQFKVPRVIRKSEAIDFMHQNLVIQP